MKFVVRRNRKGKMNHVKNIILDTIIECNLQEKLLVDKIREQWSDVVGSLHAVHSRPEFIKNKILFVTVDNSMYSNEIIMFKEAVLAKIRDITDIIEIKDVRTKIGKLYR